MSDLSQEFTYNSFQNEKQYFTSEFSSDQQNINNISSNLIPMDSENITSENFPLQSPNLSPSKMTIMKTNNNNNNNNNSNNNSNNNNNDENSLKVFNTGRWTDEEHKKFIKGIIEYGNEWKKVQKIIKTRNSTQARSHAQKFFLRIKKNLISENNNSSIDNNQILKQVISILSNDKKKEIVLSNEQKNKLLNVINNKCNNNDNLIKDNIDVDENDEKDDDFIDNLGFKKKFSIKRKEKYK